MNTSCKILKIYPDVDKPIRYNYQVNYGVWDAIDSDSTILEKLDVNLDKYDYLFVPMFKRWKGNEKNLQKVIDSKARKILFDNDSCYRTFDIDFYKPFDFIYYRCFDSLGNKPKNGEYLKWSIDTDMYFPDYSGIGISFNCSVCSKYKFREQIAKITTHTKYKHGEFIKHIQKSAAGIHASSELVTFPHAKIIEYAACGCEIISNRMDTMKLYYPDDLIIYFDSIEHLKEIIKNYTPNIEKQKELRYITETKHSNKVRVAEILSKL